MKENHTHTWKIDHTVQVPTGEGTNMKEIAFLICDECMSVQKSIVHESYYPSI